MNHTAQPLRFFYHPRSRAVITRWMLEECGARYEPVRLEYGTTMKSADYLAINPMGKVPALAHGDIVVTELAAILAYLADLYPEKRLAPAVDSPQRGSYHRWMFFLAGPVEAVMAAKSQGHLAQQTPEQAMSAGYGRYDDVVQTLRQAVAGKHHLCGDRFTAADVLMASYLRWGTMMKLLPDLPEFSAYGQPLLERPASLRAIELNEADLALQPA
ncbi:MAG: glutathione S-transferase family protein [Burkholderiaceae bacterium]|jgi:glutathione S-transferase|nr:glutathione S-transferase family protein [Burkholderiaceae bacterium]